MNISGCNKVSLGGDVLPDCGDKNSLSTLKELAIKIKKNQLSIMIENQKARIQRDVLGDGWGELGGIFTDVLMKEVAPLPDLSAIDMSIRDVNYIRSEYYSEKNSVRVCLAQIYFDFSIPKIKTKGGTDVDRFMADALLSKYNISVPKENQFRYSIRNNEVSKGMFVIEAEILD